MRGFAAGVSLLVLGFEFEYANLSEDELELLPGLRTYSGNVLVQTPTSTQLYATIGGGGYQEKLGPLEETHAGVNIGGGVKILAVRPDSRARRLSDLPTARITAAYDLSAVLCWREPERSDPVWLRNVRRVFWVSTGATDIAANSVRLNLVGGAANAS